MSRVISKIALAAIASSMLTSAAYAESDTVQAPTGFFVPSDAQVYDSPYYRSFGQDWDWTHGALTDTFTTASLNISAFDVDESSGEIDNVYAYDDGVAVLLGHLSGANDVFSFTTFTLGSNFFDDIAAGLHVAVSIDTLNEGWSLTLAKSVVTTDGTALPPPTPGVPEPASWAMMLAGFGLIGGALRRSQRSVVSFG